MLGEAVLGRQANLKESSKSKELAELRLQVLVVVITKGTICVKLALLDFFIIYNNNFGSATNLCLCYAPAKCGRLFDISEYYFCNLGTIKPVISKFVTAWQINTPCSSPYYFDYPTMMFPVDKHRWTKKNGAKNVLIPS